MFVDQDDKKKSIDKESSEGGSSEGGSSEGGSSEERTEGGREAGESPLERQRAKVEAVAERLKAGDNSPKVKKRRVSWKEEFRKYEDLAATIRTESVNLTAEKQRLEKERQALAREELEVAAKKMGSMAQEFGERSGPINPDLLKMGSDALEKLERQVHPTKKRGLGTAITIRSLPDSPTFLPYSVAAAKFRRVQVRALAKTVGKGICGPGPSSIVASAAICLAWSRYFSDHAMETGEINLALTSAQLADKSRSMLVTAHELCEKEANARNATSNPLDPLALFRSKIVDTEPT